MSQGPPPGFGTGLIQRDYAQFPSGYCASAPTFTDSDLLPESDWPARLDAQVSEHRSLYDLRELYYPFLKSLNQKTFSLCWNFSTTKSRMYTRAIMNAEPIILSPWWGAGKIKGWRDQGGWGMQSVEFAAQTGGPSLQLCPAYSRQYDTAEAAADAELHKITEWWDGKNDRDFNRRMMVTCFLLGFAPVLDFNDISHSMCGCRLVSLNPLTIDCDNSWGETDSYGEKGLYRRVGNKAIPDAITVPRVSMPT